MFFGDKWIHRIFFLWGILCISSVVQSEESAPFNSPKFSLEQAFEGYLSAVKARDIERVKSYLAEDRVLPFVNGGGKLSLGMDEYLNAQENWFADSSWTYHSDIVSLQKFRELAVIIDKTTIRTEKEGKVSDFNMMVTYVFKKDNGLWRMVTDVCSAVL